MTNQVAIFDTATQREISHNSKQLDYRKEREKKDIAVAITAISFIILGSLMYIDYFFK
ncbi:MAG: hypothetical protein HQM14_20770 [SAR324 cluster bacterium]|nr:hypothetical protein [SAR324 cluster bacterium]